MNRQLATPRALTVAAAAILICIPALLRFAAGAMSSFDLACYLALGVAISFAGLSGLAWIWGRYTTK
jgi:hypothetical protein